MSRRTTKKPLTLYDAAILPFVLEIYGVPLLIILAIVLLAVFAGKLIKNARIRNQEMLDRQARLDALAIEEDWTRRIQSANASKLATQVDAAPKTDNTDSGH